MENKRINLATTNTVSSNYAGDAGAIFGQAWKELDTLNKGLITTMDNVNHQANLRKLVYSNGTSSYSCGFVPAGTFVSSEKTIVPKKFSNPFQICKEDFRQTWSEKSMGASASNPNLPADIMEAMQLEVLSSQAAKIDDDIWNGDSANDSEFDGFIKLFTADAAIIKDGNGVTGPGHSVTESTVEADLKLALAAVPVALRKKDLTVIVSSDVAQAYNFYLISKGIAWNGTTDDKEMRFGKYTLNEVAGLPDDTIIIYEKGNLVAAFGLEADFNELSLVDEDEIGLLSGLVRGRLNYNFGVNYYNSAEIVWLLLTT